MGNDTLFGQIATFMESLHLSYDEVVFKIPYRNLLLMSRDKARALFDGEYVVRKGAGKDMMSRRMGQ